MGAGLAAAWWTTARKYKNAITNEIFNKSHQLGFLWGGPIIGLTSYSQASALDAVVAAIKLP